jgi:multidrug efflux system membrane fusion protein
MLREKENPNMSRWKIALIVAALLVAGVLAWRFLQRPDAAVKSATDAPIPVTAVTVEQRDVPIYLTALGTVQALNTVTVRPQVGGQLLSLDFEEGAEVQKGDVIARIDPRSYQATLDQALAKKKQDEAQLRASRSTLKRYEELIGKNFVSAQDLENQRQTVRQQEALIAADAAAVDTARIQFDYTTVRAPISGIAGIRQVDVGNILQANDANGIVTITQVHPINVVFTLPEQDLSLVRGGAGGEPLPVTAMDRVDSHVVADDGKLTVIANQIDTSTGTFQLKSEFPNADNALWPGQFVNVRLGVRTVHGGLVVPTEAVQRGPDGSYVYLVVPATLENTTAGATPPAPASGAGKRSANANAAKPAAPAGDVVRLQPVEVGAEADATHVLITKGLSAGDRVVTAGQFRLKPGVRVTALAPGESLPPPTAEEISKAAQPARRRGR